MEADLHVQRGGIPQCGCEEEDESQNPIQLRGFGLDCADRCLRGLQPERQNRKIHARIERGGKGTDGILEVADGRLRG